MATYRLDELTPEAWAAIEPRDILLLGAYPKATGGEPLPIEWEVLRKEDGKLLLLSAYGLDVMPYDLRDVQMARLVGEEVEPITWQNSQLRAWLNDEFWRVAFSDEERRLIAPADFTGDGQADRVSLLPWKEAKAYIRGYRKSAPLTALADEKIRKEHAFEAKMCWRWDRGWWLSTKAGEDKADCVVYDWAQESIKDNLCRDQQAVRPAVWLDPKGAYSID